jgi:hypothetical protein
MTEIIRRYTNEEPGTPVEHPNSQFAPLPSGWYIERSETDHRVNFAIFEEGGETWRETGDPRSALDIEVYKPSDFRESAEVSWPSTSDKRPALAHAVAVAIGLAAEEADHLNNPPLR